MRTSFRCTSPNTHQGAEGQEGGGERDPLTSDRPTHRFPPSIYVRMHALEEEEVWARGRGHNNNGLLRRSSGRSRAEAPPPHVVWPNSPFTFGPSGKEWKWSAEEKWYGGGGGKGLEPVRRRRLLSAPLDGERPEGYLFAR